MPGQTKVKKMSAEVESEMRVRVLDILANSDDSLNTDQIKCKDIILSDLTNQKLSRILNYLVEMGFVRKGRSKAQGRMVYKATAKMKEQGYEVDMPASRSYNGLEWDIEDIINSFNNKEEKKEEEEE